MAESNAARVLPPDTPLADRQNMIYAGTSVATGNGRAVVTATGMATQFGGISRLVQTVQVLAHDGVDTVFRSKPTARKDVVPGEFGLRATLTNPTDQPASRKPNMRGRRR